MQLSTYSSHNFSHLVACFVVWAGMDVVCKSDPLPVLVFFGLFGTLLNSSHPFNFNSVYCAVFVNGDCVRLNLCYHIQSICMLFEFGLLLSSRRIGYIRLDCGIFGAFNA